MDNIKKLILTILTLTIISPVFANVDPTTSELIRAGFWVFTLVVSLGGMLFILKKRQDNSPKEE